MQRLSRRDFSTCASSALAGLIAPELFAFSPRAVGKENLGFVNAELRPSLQQLFANFSPLPSTLSSSTLEATRKGTEAFNGPPLATPQFEERLIKSRAGDPEVKVYVINAETGAHKPAILHMHGGGFVSGSAKGSIAAAQDIAAKVDCVIVTVEYRLAPETTFAGSLEDNYSALSWLYHNAEQLGVDPKRIAVMGESAGGGHAALLALTARDRGEIGLLFQSLIYPMLDDRTGTSLHPKSPIGSLIWTSDKNRFGWRSFLGREPGYSGVPTGAVPARYQNLQGLPPAFIGVGSIDLFVDEDIAYARRLIDAGVPTQLLVVPGAYHVFDGIASQTAVARDFTSAKLAALRTAFASAA